MTSMRKGKGDFETLQKYFGHSPSSTIAAHYDEIDLERLAEIAKLAQDFSQCEGVYSEVGKGTNINSALLH